MLEIPAVAWDALPGRALADEGLLSYVSREKLFKAADLIPLREPLIPGEGEPLGDAECRA